MHETSRRLYWAAKELKGAHTLTEVAALLGVSVQTVKNWEARGMSRDGLILAQRFIGVTPDWVTAGLEPMLVSPKNVTNAAVRSRVPLVSWVTAGSFKEISDVFQPGEAEDWIDVYESTPSSGAFALRVDGDSMTSPHPGVSFPDGTIIIADPTRTGPHTLATLLSPRMCRHRAPRSRS